MGVVPEATTWAVGRRTLAELSAFGRFCVALELLLRLKLLSAEWTEEDSGIKPARLSSDFYTPNRQEELLLLCEKEHGLLRERQCLLQRVAARTELRGSGKGHVEKGLKFRRKDLPVVTARSRGSTDAGCSRR